MGKFEMSPSKIRVLHKVHSRLIYSVERRHCLQKVCPQGVATGWFIKFKQMTHSNSESSYSLTSTQLLS